MAEAEAASSVLVEEVVVSTTEVGTTGSAEITSLEVDSVAVSVSEGDQGATEDIPEGKAEEIVGCVGATRAVEGTAADVRTSVEEVSRGSVSEVAVGVSVVSVSVHPITEVNPAPEETGISEGLEATGVVEVASGTGSRVEVVSVSRVEVGTTTGGTTSVEEVSLEVSLSVSVKGSTEVNWDIPDWLETGGTTTEG